MYTDMYEITDDTGTLFSGNEEEILIIWDKIRDSNWNKQDFKGDVRLIQIKDITWKRLTP